MRSFISYMLFFPSITFGIVGAEIFPWAFFYSVTKFKVLLRENKNIITLITLVLVWGGLSFTYFEVPSSEILITLVAYANPILIFIVLIRMTRFKKNFRTIIRNILIFMTVFGMLQYFKLTGFFEGVYTTLIPRGNVQILDNINRGISIFTTEPSRAAIEFIFLSYTLRLFLKKSYELYFDIFVILFSVFIIKGGYGLLYSTIYFLLTFKRSYFKILIPALLVSFFLFSQQLKNLNDERGVQLASKVLSSDDQFFTLVNLSGFRVVSTFSSFIYGFENVIGGGFGNWKKTSVEALAMTNFNSNEISYFSYNFDGYWSEVKPTSFIGNLMLDFGIIGTLIFLVLLYRSASGYVYIHDRGKFLILFAVYFLIFGYLGHPIPFICLGLYYNKNVFGFNSNSNL